MSMPEPARIVEVADIIRASLRETAPDIERQLLNQDVEEIAMRVWPVIAGHATSAVRELVADLTDEDPCWFDHHGYCLAHGWTATDPGCPHARAKAFLAAQGVTS